LLLSSSDSDAATGHGGYSGTLGLTLWLFFVVAELVAQLCKTNIRKTKQQTEKQNKNKECSLAAHSASNMPSAYETHLAQVSSS
jgi:hypothetical protein